MKRLMTPLTIAALACACSDAPEPNVSDRDADAANETALNSVVYVGSDFGEGILYLEKPLVNGSTPTGEVCIRKDTITTEHTGFDDVSFNATMIYDDDRIEPQFNDNWRYDKSWEDYSGIESHFTGLFAG